MKLTVPFAIDGGFQGFAETQGILSVDGTDLKLEFQTADNLVGLLKSAMREVRLPLDTIQQVSFRKGWFRRSVIIRVAEMGRASEIPNFSQGEIVLSIARKHSQIAADFVSSLPISSSR
jgi:hypothetical protein